MTAYHQMGHHSANLVLADELDMYGGAILSPVNRNPAEMHDLLRRVRNRRSNFDLVFDPQLYYPRSERGALRSWNYFPNNFETADYSYLGWWDELLEAIAETCRRLDIDSVCSPAIVPRVFSSADVYTLGARNAEALEELLPSLSVLQTVLVGLGDIAEPNRPEMVASLVSNTSCRRVYLVVVTDIEPRREIADVEALKGLLRLISLLESAGIRVTVGFSSSDVVLWKAAGASACATGKFFNLRRFTSSRFDEPSGGGGQLPYWFEERVLSYLRESDVVRVRNAGGFSESSQRNPFANEILDSINTGQAWLGTAWRQYLWWFGDYCERAQTGSAADAVRAADAVWKEFDRSGPLMEEFRNDGSWVRQWRRALMEYEPAAGI